MGNRRTAGHLAALFTIIIWGTTFISTKVLLTDFKPVEILFFRFVMGFAALFLVCPHRMKGVGRRQELTFVLAGLCGICLYYLLENIALTYTMASNVGVDCVMSPSLRLSSPNRCTSYSAMYHNIVIFHFPFKMFCILTIAAHWGSGAFMLPIGCPSF